MGKESNMFGKSNIFVLNGKSNILWWEEQNTCLGKAAKLKRIC